MVSDHIYLFFDSHIKNEKAGVCRIMVLQTKLAYVRNGSILALGDSPRLSHFGT
jgi:hypothetical protein